MSESNNKLWYILAGAAALVGAAVAYHFITQSSDEGNEELKEELQADLNAIKEVRKENGIIKLEDFVTIFKTVTKHAKKKTKKIKETYAAERRAALKAGDEATY